MFGEGEGGGEGVDVEAVFVLEDDAGGEAKAVDVEAQCGGVPRNGLDGEGAAAVDLDADLVVVGNVLVVDGVGFACKLELDFLGAKDVIAKAGGDLGQDGVGGLLAALDAVGDAGDGGGDQGVLDGFGAGFWGAVFGGEVLVNEVGV